jgi:hypothetical protein
MLTRPRAAQADQYGIQEIQQDAEANFPNECGAYSAF